MAVGNFIVVATSPHRIRYSLASDGAGAGTQIRTRAQIIADCANGPLKALLQKILEGSAEWSGLGSSDTRVSILSTVVTAGGSGFAQYLVNLSPSSISFTVTAATTQAVFEILFNHSLVR